MHEKVVYHAQMQAQEHIDAINWESGELMSKWDQLKRWFAENPIIRTIKTIMDKNQDESRDIIKDYVVGKYARGTNFHPGGFALVGEEGPELIDLPKGTKVHSNQKSMNMMKNKMEHTGTIKVVGVNNNDEFVGVVDMVMEQLRREVRS